MFKVCEFDERRIERGEKSVPRLKPDCIGMTDSTGKPVPLSKTESFDKLLRVC
jgi:hypothetical protein